jgi:NAD(P)-dependent dehydrogenase (short-subunit alcohol dehydrogenase family)
VHGTIDTPIVVVGATGTIGKTLTGLLVAAGQPVVAVAPEVERLETLCESAGSGAVIPLVGRVDSDGDAKALANRLRALGRPLAGVVVTFPYGRSSEVGADRGRLIDQSTDALCDCLKQTLLAQHALARHLVPLLAETGRNARYVIVGGPGSETPWAGYGHRSVAMAATRMLARVLNDEARPLGVRVQLLSIDSPMRSDPPREHECPEWPAATDVARRVAGLLDRTTTDESSQAVVACTRLKVARAIGSATRAFNDVPSFLASLRSPQQEIPRSEEEL